MKKTSSWSLALLVGLLLLTSCTTAQPTVSATQAAAYPYPGIDGGTYPMPVVTADPNYPGPEVDANLPPTPRPTQDATLGSARGSIFNNGDPAEGAMLYLAEVIKSPEGVETVASYSRETSPYTNVEENGDFFFFNLKPGKYGLVLDTVVNAYLLNWPDKENQPIFFVAEAGKETEIEKLEFTDMPLN